MRSIEWLVKGTISIVLLTVLAACGSSSDNNVETSPDSTYLVEYIPGSTPATEGKTTFQVKIRNRSDGSAAMGLSVSLAATMHMPQMSHGTPIDVVKESESTPGTYDCTVYYSMGDHSMGNLKGYWDLQVKIGSETATFYPSVGSQMSNADTWKKSMKSTADAASGIAYYLYSDGMVSAATPTFKLYLTRYANMMYTPISAVSGPTGTVNSVNLVASKDPAFPLVSGQTVTATDDGYGHFSMPGLSGLVSGVTSTIYVKLNVNGQDKTADGATVSDTNAAIFSVTPGI